MKNIPELNVNNLPHPNDRIVELLSHGLSEEETYHQMCEELWQITIPTIKQKQALADGIAQINQRNVFAIGKIPGGK
mgnify:FL=1